MVLNHSCLEVNIIIVQVAVSFLTTYKTSRIPTQDLFLAEFFVNLQVSQTWIIITNKTNKAST